MCVDILASLSGDRIFITSTDYDWRQVEEFTVMPCPTCTPNQVKLDSKSIIFIHRISDAIHYADLLLFKLSWSIDYFANFDCNRMMFFYQFTVPTKYEHFGQIYKNVDMRAEVGLMSRHIHIRGEVSDGQTNGGHIKVYRTFYIFNGCRILIIIICMLYQYFVYCCYLRVRRAFWKKHRYCCFNNARSSKKDKKWTSWNLILFSFWKDSAVFASREWKSPIWDNLWFWVGIQKMYFNL